MLLGADVDVALRLLIIALTLAALAWSLIRVRRGVTVTRWEWLSLAGICAMTMGMLLGHWWSVGLNLIAAALLLRINYEIRRGLP